MDRKGRDWRLPLVVGLVLLGVAGALIGVAFRGGLLGEDRGLLTGLAGDRTPRLTAAAVAWTTVGNTVATATLAIVVGAVLYVRGHRGEGVYLVAVTATASLVFTVVKDVLDRARPPAQLQVIRETDESLPSGHATMSATVFSAIVLLAWPYLAALGRTLATAGAVLWVGAVGTTRVYLGVHWFSDVLAGWALGVGAATTGVALLFWWQARAPAVPPGTTAPSR